MVEKTEFGILCSFEEWEEIQDKLNSTDSSDQILKLKEENQGLRRTLSGINSFLSEESV